MQRGVIFKFAGVSYYSRPHLSFSDTMQWGFTLTIFYVTSNTQGKLIVRDAY